MKQNIKLKVAFGLLILFAILFVLTIEDPAAGTRKMLPIAGAVLFAYIIYCAVTLLRRSDRLADDAPQVECSCNGAASTTRQGKTKTK